MIRIALGTAPMYGPKNGMTFVTPTITLTNNVYGIFKIDNPKKHSTPIIAESMIFPIINPPKEMQDKFLEQVDHIDKLEFVKIMKRDSATRDWSM